MTGPFQNQHQHLDGSPDTPRSARIWRNIASLAASQGLTVTVSVMLATSGPVVGKGLAPDPALATLPISLQVLVTLVTLIPLSNFMARRGRVAGFALGALAGCAGAACGALAIITAEFWLLCVGALLLGVAMASGQFFRFAAADAAPDALRPRALALVVGGGVVAAFAGPALSQHSRDLWLPYAFLGNFIAMGILFALIFLVLPLMKLPNQMAPAAAEGGRSLTEIVRQPGFLMASAASIGGYSVMVLIMTATPLAILDCGYGFSDAAFVIQWHVVAMFLPSLFTGNLITRFGVFRILIAGIILMVAAMVVDLSGQMLDQFWLGLLLVGLGWNLLYVGGSSLLTTVYRPEERAKVQAANDSLVFLGASVSSLMSGALHEGLGWNAVNWAAAPILIVLIAVSLFYGIRLRRQIAVPG